MMTLLTQCLHPAPDQHMDHPFSRASYVVMFGLVQHGSAANAPLENVRMQDLTVNT